MNATRRPRPRTRAHAAAALGAMALVALAGLVGPASGFHGASWTGRATLVHAATGATLLGVASWSGQTADQVGVLRLVFDSPAPFHVHLVGLEDVSAVTLDGCLEVVDPYRNEALGAGPTLYWIGGVQSNDLCSPCFCRTDSHYHGRLLASWDVRIDVVGDKDAVWDD